MDWVEMLLRGLIGGSIGAFITTWAVWLVSPTPEKKVKQKMVKYLKEMGAYYFFPQMGGFGRSGVPDIVCCIKGMFIGLECKAARNTTTALQELELGRIREAGGSTWVVNEHNVDEVASVLFILSETATPEALREKVSAARAQMWGPVVNIPAGMQYANVSHVGVAQQSPLQYLQGTSGTNPMPPPTAQEMQKAQAALQRALNNVK